MHPLIGIIAAARAAAVEPGPPPAPTAFDRDIELIDSATQIYTESDGAITAPYTIRIQHVDLDPDAISVSAWADHNGFDVTLWAGGEWLEGPQGLSSLTPGWHVYGLLWEEAGQLDDLILRIEPREGHAEVTAGIVVSVAPA